MESNNGGQPNQITGNVLFYNKPEPLNFAAHGKLGVQKIAEPFGFLRQAHAVPLTTAEFGIAATSFPIIFVGDDRAFERILNRARVRFVDEMVFATGVVEVVRVERAVFLNGRFDSLATLPVFG